LSEKAEILRKSFGNCYVNNNELLFECPKCDHHKKKLSVNIEKDVFKCWVCGYTGKRIRHLIRAYSSYDNLLAWDEQCGATDLSRYEFLFSEEVSKFKEKIELPCGFKTLTGPSSPLKKRPLDYLYSRGFTYSDILNWRVGFCDYGEYENRIIVPSFDADGDLNYFVARNYANDNSYKYRNPQISKDIIFNDLDILWDHDLILCEGVFDAMKCTNAIPLLGSSLNEKSKLFQKICYHRPRVFLGLDSDAKHKEFYIMKKLKEHDVISYSLNIEPYSDIGEMPKHEIENRKSSADFITDTDYLKYKLDF